MFSNITTLLRAVLILLPLSVFSQKETKIDLIGANTLEFDKKIGEDVKRLIGDVALKHDDTYLYCDSAYLYSGSNNVDAYGNVRINSGSVKITGKVLKYDGDTKTAQMFENVKMTDKEMTLTTDFLTFNTKTNIGNYTTGGKIVDPQNVLTSTIGYYYSDDKLFFFKNNVVLVNPKYTMYSDTLKYNTGSEIAYFYGPTTIVSKENTIYCENGWYDTKKDVSQFNKNAHFTNKKQDLTGDSLYYNRFLGFGEAFNNIILKDSAKELVIRGNYAFYNEKEHNSMITEKAVLVQKIQDDSLYIHGDTIKAFFDSTGTGKMILAYHKVKFFKTDMQGLGDSIVYSFLDSTILFYTNPMLWSDKNQISGDTIQIFLSNNKISKMNLYSSSFIISKNDTSTFNQIKGKYLTGYFIDNHLNKIHVTNNGETIYYIKDENSASIGINKATSENLLIYVDSNEVRSITFIAKPEATLYPEKDLTITEQFLKDFKWEEFNRPARKEDIFD